MAYIFIKPIFNMLKYTVSLKFIMFVRLLVGLYYKISSNKVITFVSAVYCVFFNVAITYCGYSLFEFMPAAFNMKLFAILTLYYTSSLVSLLSDSEGFGVHIKDLRDCDSVLGAKSCMDIPVSRFLFITTTLTMIGVYTHYLVVKCAILTRIAICITFFVFLYMTTLTNFARIIMFELLWYRMKLFRKSFEKTLNDISINYCDDNAAANLRNSMRLYKKISDITNKTKVSMKLMITLTILVSFGKLLLGLYEIKAKVLNDEELIPVWIQETIVDIVLPFMPVIFSELIVCELTAIKLDIGRHIMGSKDERLRDILEDCLSFLQHHSCRVTVLRLFRVDCSLLVTFVNQCITYALALVQFAHLND